MSDKADIDKILAEINKKVGGLVIGRGSDPEIMEKIDYAKLSTLITQLDHYLGGGIPVGKNTLLSGPWSSGKTTLSLQIACHYLQENPEMYVLVVDSEGSWDKVWIEKHGGDLSRFLFIEPGVMEDQMDAAVHIANELGDLIGIAIVDSVGGLVPRIEYQGKKKTASKDRDDLKEFSISQDNMAAAARKLGQFLRVWNVHSTKHEIATIIITHVYADLNSQHGGMKAKGGNAMEHSAHVHIKMYSMRDKQAFEEDILCSDGEVRKVQTGFWSNMIIEKCRQAPSQGVSIRVPFKKGLGYDSLRALISSCVGHKIITRKGSWYFNGEEKIGQGIGSVMKRAEEDESWVLSLREELMTTLEANQIFA